MTDKLVQEYGFNNLKEFFKLVGELDLSTSKKQKDFKNWQNNDGSKKGLLALNNS